MTTSHLKNSKDNDSIFELSEPEIEINNQLDLIKSNIDDLYKKSNNINQLNLEEEKKLLKEIKLKSEDLIQIVKKSKILITKHINNNDDDGDIANDGANSIKIKLPIKEGFNIQMKDLVQSFYKAIYFYTKRLLIKMFQMYRIIKSDLSDQEIEKALYVDSSPDQIFFKSSFGFSDFSENAKQALVFIQYRHYDLKSLELILKDIESISKDFNINWKSLIDTNKIILVSPNLQSKQQTEQQTTKLNYKSIEYKEIQNFKKTLKTSNRKFLLFNIWCCGNN
ncbi:hypothetical protein RB653_000044 [Dictyostelium firmibasis]|uniref:Uncharacterized protein n=1 Tax=Dictyostelium firmibasis TaxID=79012 RepID=A0AAN7U1N0_9MYCE